MNKIDLLKRILEYKNEQEYINQLYDEVVSKTWWSNSSITNNAEREKYLYREFVEYYDIINEQCSKIFDYEKLEKTEDLLKISLWLIGKCRNQLEKELERIRNSDYIKEE